MAADSQNIYINNICFRTNFILLCAILFTYSLILFVQYKKNRIRVIKTKNNLLLKFFVLYYCTILPINYICKDQRIDKGLINGIRLINDYASIFVIALCAAFFLNLNVYKNKYTVLNAVKNPFIFIVYTLSLSEAIGGEINFLNFHNLITILILVILSTLMHSLFIYKINDYDQSNVNLNYDPIKNLDDFFNERIWQKNDFINYIENNHNVKSICVSAEWGQGKTSFINIVENELIRKEYPVIRINALDFSGLDALFKYYFEQLEGIIKNYGYYKGFSSEFSNFTKTLADIILDYNKIKISINKSKDYSYITEKQNLQNILSEALGSKKLIIIVDDVERCDPDISIQYIRFIKEITTFNKSVVIFLSDYEELLKLPNISDKYIQKFIDYRFDIRVLNYREILSYITKKHPNIINFIDDINFDISSEIDNILFKYKSEIINLKNNRMNKKDDYNAITSNINILTTKHDELEKKLNNPRVLNKLCENIINKKNSIIYNLKNEKNSNDLVVFLKNINITKSVVTIALIQTLFPLEYEKIKRSSLKYYIENLEETREQLERNKNYVKIKTLDEEIIVDICKDLWFSDLLFTTTKDYFQIRAVEFINNLIKEPEMLKSSIAFFSSKEDEYISYIKNDNWEKIDKPYLDLVNMVLKRYFNLDPKEAASVIKKVFEHYMKIESKNNNNINKCFGIFAYTMDMYIWKQPDTSCLESFYTAIHKGKYVITERETYEKMLSNFSYYYLQNTFIYIFRAIQYNIYNFDLKDSDYESKFNFHEKSFDLMIKRYVKIIVKQEKDSVLDNLNILSEYINITKTRMKDYNYEYDDVKVDIFTAEKQIREYKYLNEIIEYVSRANDTQIMDVTISRNPSVDIEKYINYLQSKTTFNYQEEYYRLFNFTENLFNESNSSRLSIELIDSYNKLVTIYFEKVRGDVKIFRIRALKILKEINRNNKINSR